ncbi:MAG: DUF6660 family protein [Bacteroidota bacterium]|nr:DUF6660 family protein [Bacteroidota bacterium]
MRPLFFLLSCFILFLSCLACSDSNECKDETAIAIASTDTPRDHNHDEEACTPFCTCSCCAVSIFYSIIPKILDLKIIFQPEKHLISNIAFNTEAYYSIWQPPKIS